MKVFPTRLYFFQGHAADIERRTVSGGTSIAGEEDVVATDGGGRVFAEFAEADLDDPEVAISWRALDALGDGGVTPIIVPLGDARHQMMGDVTTPIGGLPWWSEADFPANDAHAALSSPALLRATTLTVNVAKLARPIRAGIWLSVDHAAHRHRAYKVGEVLDRTDTTATFTIRPPLRESTPANTPVEFYDPKCTMRVDGDMRSPTTLGYAEGSVRFVEYPGVPA